MKKKIKKRAKENYKSYSNESMRKYDEKNMMLKKN